MKKKIAIVIYKINQMISLKNKISQLNAYYHTFDIISKDLKNLND